MNLLPRNDALRKSLRPVYREYAGWDGDLSSIRSFGDLPEEAKAYVAGMVKGILDSAFHGETLPESLPNLRYLGVGPMPSQIIKDIPQKHEEASKTSPRMS